MKNVSIWYQKKPIPQLSIFCLIQGINNYAQINTYWTSDKFVFASNIWACLSANITICNVVIGIINEP
jgi:hypothetical protein